MQSFQTFTPFEYLLIDVANNFGLDKALYATRIQWTKDNLDNLEEHVVDADSPNMYWKSVDAVRCAQAGIPTGHLVGFDSAASGIQLMSVTARCNVGMFNTGVINDENAIAAPDVYKKCTAIMNRNDYVRKAVKGALMTYFYGSELQPKVVFGEGADLELFMQASKLVAPEAFDLRNILINLWQANTLAHKWNMPDRGVVFKRVWKAVDYKVQEPLLGSSFTFRTNVNMGKKKGVSLAADVIHSLDAYLLRELNRRCNFDVIQLNQALDIINLVEAANGELVVTDRENIVSLVEVEYLTLENVSDYTFNQLAQLKEIIIQSLNFGSFELVCIHDEFKCHANHMNKLRKHYNIILCELYYSNIMSDIVEEIGGQKVFLLPPDDATAHQILNSNYSVN
jgi:hypothetical protein